MPDGFSNPLVGGGGALVYPSIHSPGFIAGATGWSIDKNGNAQFSGLVITQAAIQGITETLNPGPLLIYGNTTLTFVVLTGAGLWTAPAGVTSANVHAIGAGAGQVEGFGGPGGEYAFDSVAVTPASMYAYSVGAGGAAGGGSGGNTTFTGDTLTVTAHGATATSPGRGSTNSIHNNGGAAGVRSGSAPHGGAGGGSAGGKYSPGNPGLTNTGLTGGAGGAAVAADGVIASGPGGLGGNNGANGNTPAGFGGGAGEAGTGGTPAAGAAGGLILSYVTAGTTSLIISAASAAGTDPNTGINYQRGLTLIDPTLGDTTNIYGGVITVSGGFAWQLKGADFDIQTVGKGLRVAEGANARQGRATLTAGTSGALANTSITANTHIWLSRETAGAGVLGDLSSTRVAGTSFTINSSAGTDVSTVSWLLTEPG